MCSGPAFSPACAKTSAVMAPMVVMPAMMVMAMPVLRADVNAEPRNPDAPPLAVAMAMTPVTMTAALPADLLDG